MLLEKNHNYVQPLKNYEDKKCERNQSAIDL